MDQVLSAHQSSQLLIADVLRNCTDGNQVDARKLLHGLQEQCRSLLAKLEKDDVKSNSTKSSAASFDEVTLLHILLCCPSVAELPLLQAQNEFSVLVIDSPLLTDKCFSIVVRGLKWQPIVYPLLSSFPIEVVSAFLTDALNDARTVNTTGLMSFITELIRVMIFRVCSGDVFSNLGIIDIIKTTFTTIAKLSFPSNSSKLPYFILHLFELLKLFLEATCNGIIEKPNVSLVSSTLREIFPLSNHQNDNNVVTKYSSSFIECCTFFFNICQELIENISVEIWIQWADIDWTPSLFCCNIQSASKISVQNLLAYRAHDILRISQLINISHDEACKSVAEQKTKVLHSVQAGLLARKTLFSFLQQVAVDCHVDPDSELSLEEILSVLEIPQEGEKDADVLKDVSQDRKQKLLKIVMKNSHLSNFFTIDKTADILLKNSSLLPKCEIEELLKSFLHHFAALQHPQHWQKVMLELCRGLDEECLCRAAMWALQQDPVCRDWLSSPSYDAHLTALCNSLTHDTVSNVQETASSSALRVGRSLLWWTCLQKPSCTVERLVQHALTVTGMEATVAAALNLLAPVCRASLETQPVSLLTSVLKKHAERESSPQCSNDQKPFVKLLTLLCKLDRRSESASPGTGCAVVIPEVVRELLLPQLRWLPNGEDDAFSAVESLEMPLLLLQAIVHHQNEEFYSSLSTDNDLVAFVVFLITSLQKCEALLAPAPSPAPAACPSEALRPDERSGQRAMDRRSLRSAADGLEPSVMDLSPPQVMQVMSLMTVMKQLLSRASQHLSNDNCTASSRELLCKYFLKHPSKYSYSSVVYVIDILYTCCGGDVRVCSPESKCALLVDCLHANMEEGSSMNSRFSIMTLWTREEWLISLCQILPTASPEEWRALANIADSVGPTDESVTTSENKMRGLNLLSDALFLLMLQPRANVGFLCSNFTSSVIQYVKRECEQMAAEAQLELLCGTFVWWCQRRCMLVIKNESLSAAQEREEQSQLLLLRIVELLRDLMAVHYFSNVKASSKKKTETVSLGVASYASSNKVDTSKCGNKLTQETNSDFKDLNASGLNFRREAGERAMVQSLLEYSKGDESLALVAAQLIGVFDTFY